MKKFIIVDVFSDRRKAEEIKEEMMAMGKVVVLKEAYGITVNEYKDSVPSLKYERDGNPLFVLISE